ncbi:phosphotransferase [uncultured Roseibium sp.]|uniref:phosphotransferase n=1 Tax=uncultured Roseibium sp. TaxID=1936171 RepID=UPI00260F3115|nr:phosphotransferase [uncultured Roseibium sp.]
MSVSIPRAPIDIDADWLSEVLSDHGRHGPVQVKELTVTPSTRWNVADTAFLEAEFVDPPADLPARFFLKIRQDPDPLADIFPGEQVFYATANKTGLPLADCFVSLVDPSSGATCILLEDLSTTHVATPWPMPPTLPHCHMAVRSLAALHAHWAQSATDDLNKRERVLGLHVSEMLPAFLAKLGDRLPEDRAVLLERVCERIPALKADRYKGGGTVTRIHGDAHFWNVLYPRDENRDDAILIDWEDWRVDFAGMDLALMIAMHWYPHRRAFHEVNLLKSYLQTYNASASTRISWEDFWHDYRLGHVCNAVVPVFQHSADNTHASWWSHLERWFLAFEDLNCRELLE